jgi:hypothetical protein
MLGHAAPQADIDTGLRLMWLALALPGFASPRVAVQACVAVLSFLLLVGYISLLFVRIH